MIMILKKQTLPLLLGFMITFSMNVNSQNNNRGFLQVGGPGGQGGQQQCCQQQSGEPMCLDHCPSVCVARRVSVPGHGRILLHGPGFA